MKEQGAKNRDERRTEGAYELMKDIMFIWQKSLVPAYRNNKLQNSGWSLYAHSIHAQNTGEIFILEMYIFYKGM